MKSEAEAKEKDKRQKEEKEAEVKAELEKSKCQECGKQLKSKTGLIQHMKIHKKVHECQYCKKLFARNNHVKSHLLSCRKNKSRKARTDSGKKDPNSKLAKVPCEECNREFSSNSNLQRHVRSEHRGKVFKCDLCDKNYNSNHARQTHITSHHGGKKQFQCKICRKEFSHQQSYSRHKESKAHIEALQVKKK